MTPQHVHDAVAEVLLEHVEKVAAWRRGEPGSWGYLAGQAVMACKERIGRALTEDERRRVWSLLWERLNRADVT